MNNQLIINFYNQGIKKLNAQKFKEATFFFNKVIELNPNHINSIHALGLINGAQNKHDIAKSFFQRALSLDSSFVPSKINLAAAYFETTEYNKAIEIYEEIITSVKDNYIVYFNLANCYFKLSKNKKAIIYYKKAIDIDPNQFQSYLNLGILEKINLNFSASGQNLEKAHKINPNNSLLNYHIGDLMFKLKEFNKAIEFLEIALKLDPINENTKEKLAYAYLEIKDKLKAQKIIEGLLQINTDPFRRETLFINFSSAIVRINDDDFYADYSLAKKYAKEALKINPNNFIGLSNLGICNLMEKDFFSSVLNLEKALEKEPKSKLVLKNLASVYSHVGLYEKSEKTIKKLLNFYPDAISLNLTLATSLFSQNKFSEAWHYYEQRWNKNAGTNNPKTMPKFIKPLWTPELGYGSILVWAEQGLGDQLLHGTMLKDFSKKFEKTFLAIDPRLCQIFQESFPEIKVFSLFDEFEQNFFDYHIPLTSIGRYCRNSINDFLPIKIPYSLNLEKNMKSNNKQKIKCALSWKSVNGMKSDFKSINLELLRPVLEIENIDYYNIQYTDENDEIKKMKDKYGIKIIKPENVDPHKDIYGLMKFIKSCDFVITISNTNAHLAGGIGVPTYLLLSDAYGKFWYWDNMFEGKNLWYPSIERFIQKEHRNWSHPVNELLNKIKEKYV